MTSMSTAKLGATVIKRNELLVKVMEAIRDINWVTSRKIPLMHFDAYEFLMTMYASNAGNRVSFTPRFLNCCLHSRSR